MKTCSTLALVSVVIAAATSTAHAANCDFGAIQGKLFSNATDGLRKCASETGVDIWAIKTFPTEKQAQSVMTSRTCVDFLNQINERANREIQCDIQIGDTVKGFGSFITDVLTGQTGNQTEVETGSNDVEVPDDDVKGNAQVKASSLDGTDSAGTLKKSATAPKTVAPTPTPTSAAVSSSVSIASASAVAVVALALQW